MPLAPWHLVLSPRAIKPRLELVDKAPTFVEAGRRRPPLVLGGLVPCGGKVGDHQSSAIRRNVISKLSTEKDSNLVQVSWPNATMMSLACLRHRDWGDLLQLGGSGKHV